MIIAIDGPSGAGKSTLARRLAERLGIIYVDTGAMYRSIGVYALRQGVEPSDAARVAPLLPQIQLSLTFVDGAQHVILNGEDVSEAIRRPEASMAASRVSALPEVRRFLLDLQRDFGRKHSIVMDGRDIGTVIFPDADVKIFLTASAEQRAQRRYKEQVEKGFEVDYDTLLAEIRQRDHNDSTRDIAPLKPAKDAVLLDTTTMDLEQSLEALLEIVRSKTNVV